MILINVVVIVPQTKTKQGKHIFENFGLSLKEACDRLEFRNKPTSNAKTSIISAMLNRYECQNVS